MLFVTSLLSTLKIKLEKNVAVLTVFLARQASEQGVLSPIRCHRIIVDEVSFLGLLTWTLFAKYNEHNFYPLQVCLEKDRLLLIFSYFKNKTIAL